MRDFTVIKDQVEHARGLLVQVYPTGILLGDRDGEVFVQGSTVKWLIEKLTGAVNGEWISE